MYKEFYGFSEYPFNLSPDPRFLFLAVSHYEALSSMIAGVRERKGITIITGEPGTGKTTLIYALLKNLSEKIKTAFVFQTKLSFQDLLMEILTELEVPVLEDNLSSLLVLFSQCLKEKMARDETVAIIIDEAQNLDIEVMENLFRLYTRESPEAKLVQILLVGQPEFEAKLDSPELQKFKDRVALRRRLRPLNQKECEEYIDHRLKIVGSSSSKVFTPEAITRISRFSGGIPRVINILCDHALLTACHSRPKIDEKIAGVAIRELAHLGPDQAGSEGGANPGPITPVMKRAVQGLARLKIHRAFSLPSRSRLYSILFLLIFTALAFSLFHFLDWNLDLNPPWERKEKAVSLEKPAERIVSVREGWNLNLMARQYYHTVNPTLLDLILEFNPQITDLNRIFIDQQIKMPTLTEDLILLKTPDHKYKIHLGTFSGERPVQPFKNNPVLKGKRIEIVSRRVTPRDTWFRVLAGEYQSKEEGLKVIRALRQQGLLPAFAASPK
jgi:general secretion pathway protein A